MPESPLLFVSVVPACGYCFQLQSRSRVVKRPLTRLAALTALFYRRGPMMMSVYGPRNRGNEAKKSLKTKEDECYKMQKRTRNERDLPPRVGMQLLCNLCRQRIPAPVRVSSRRRGMFAPPSAFPSPSLAFHLQAHPVVNHRLHRIGQMIVVQRRVKFQTSQLNLPRVFGSPDAAPIVVIGLGRSL